MPPEISAAEIKRCEKVAAYICRKANSFQIYDDAKQEAMMALLDARTRFVEGHGAGFKTFSDQRIHGAVWDLLRRERIVKRPGSDPVRLVSAESVIRDSEDPDNRTLLSRLQVVPDIERELDGKRCYAMLDRLSPRSRQALIDWSEGRTKRATAKEIGVHETWIGHLNSASIERLRGLLKQAA